MSGMQAQLWHVAMMKREEEIGRAEARRLARRVLAEQRAQRAAGRQPRLTAWWSVLARRLARPARGGSPAGAVPAQRTGPEHSGPRRRVRVETT